MPRPSESLAAPATYVVKTAADLTALQAPHVLLRARRRRVRIETDSVSWEQIKGWEARLNATANACGCSEGATAAIIGTGIGILTILLRDSRALVPGLGAVVAFGLLGGMIGKAIGLRRAQARFRRTVSEIEQALQAREAVHTTEQG